MYYLFLMISKAYWWYMWIRWHCLCDSPHQLASDTHKISVYLPLILCAEILELMLFIHIARSVLIWVQMGQKSSEDGGSRYKSQWYGFITKGILSYFWVWLQHSHLQQFECFSCVGFLPYLWKTVRACVVLEAVNMPSFLFCSFSCLSWFALRIVRDSNPAFFSSEMDKMYRNRGDIYHLTGLWSSEALDDRCERALGDAGHFGSGGGGQPRPHKPLLVPLAALCQSSLTICS